MAADEFRKEEFALLKGELADRERAMGSLLTIALVSSVSLLSALVSLSVGDASKNLTEWPFAFIFLAPLFIIVPVARLILSHRREIHKIGSYLQAFYDERDTGTRWEVRVEAFREHFERRHTLDAVPALFWAVFILCLAAFVYGCHHFHGPALPASLAFIAPFAVLARFHREWSECPTKDRTEYLKIWRTIRNEEA